MTKSGREVDLEESVLVTTAGTMPPDDSEHHPNDRQTDNKPTTIEREFVHGA